MEQLLHPGALIAALVVVLLTEGPRGLLTLGARLIRWRVSWVWYGLAIAVPLLVHLTSISINAGLASSAPSLGLLTPWYGIPLAIALHMISPFGGPLMEEPSFRGFAQPELQEGRSRLAATAIMAVLVTGWHLPLFFMPVFEAPPIGVMTTLAVTFWYAWLLNQASGSVLITLIAHGTEGAVETNSLWGPGADLVASTMCTPPCGAWSRWAWSSCTAGSGPPPPRSKTGGRRPILSTRTWPTGDEPPAGRARHRRLPRTRDGRLDHRGADSSPQRHGEPSDQSRSPP